MAQLSQEVGFIIIVSAFLLLVAVGIVTLVFVYRQKQVSYIQEQTRLKTAFEKELLEAQLEVREQTMRQIAQELHDNIGAMLSLTNITLAGVDFAKPDGAAKVAHSKELITKAVGAVRTLSKTLHTEAVLSAGLESAIQMELELVAKTGVFQTAFAAEGDPVDVNPQKELILFRTVQEALNNAVKHSGGDTITVHLGYATDALRITVHDNGTGFNFQTTPTNGSGMRNMRNRTNVMGGDLAVTSDNGGTRIQITLPTTDL